MTRPMRAVPAAHALAWFTEAMRLWKRGPATFCAIACIVVILSILTDPVPYLGFVAANIVAPLLATGLLYGCLAADRGEPPRLRHMLAVFTAPAAAMIAVVAAGLVIFAAEAFAAWTLADLNLLLPTRDTGSLDAATLVAIFAIGVVASLPVTFVPFAALFDGVGVAEAFTLSTRAFQLNLQPLAVFAAIAILLLLAGLATMGVGLVLALPWIAAASYAAWKDVFAVPDAAPSQPGG
jgi:uncharacterized membrane protein